MNFYLKSINKTTTKNSSAHNSTLKKKKKNKKMGRTEQTFFQRGNKDPTGI